MFIKKKTSFLYRYAKFQVGKLKSVLIKVKKNLNSNCGCSKSFKGFSEVAKNGSHAFKLLERILWV